MEPGSNQSETLTTSPLALAAAQLSPTPQLALLMEVKYAQGKEASSDLGLRLALAYVDSIAA